VASFFVFLTVVGGAIAVLQTLGALFGVVGHDGPDLHGEHALGGHTAEAEHGSTLDAFHFRSTRAIAAGVAFTGLGGLLALRQFSEPLALALALVLGAAIYVFVAFVMRGFTRFEADGSVNPDQAIGLTAVVSLPIPGGRTNPGKVRLVVAGRHVEWPAVQAEPAPADSLLPSGTRVQVVDVMDETTLTVVALPEQIESS
jgi:membrane protein implicated in regulation of membrane protease activity